MTIKILKQGRLLEEVTYKFACHHCATEFTAQRKDGKVNDDQREGRSLEVNCPLCSTKCYSWSEHRELDTQLQYPHDKRGWHDRVVEGYLPR